MVRVVKVNRGLVVKYGSRFFERYAMLFLISPTFLLIPLDMKFVHPYIVRTLEGKARDLLHLLLFGEVVMLSFDTSLETVG